MPLGNVVYPGWPVHWRRVPRRRPGTTAGGSGGARAGMAAPLVLVVLAAVTVRAALYRSSLAVFIAERVEVASPLNAWKRGEARRALAEAPLAGPTPAGAARRSPTPAGRRPGSGPAGCAPGCALGMAGPGRAVLARARARAARKSPGQLCPGGARGSRCSAAPGAGGPRGWRQSTGLDPQRGHWWCHTWTQTGACDLGPSRCPCTGTVSWWECHCTAPRPFPLVSWRSHTLAAIRILFWRLGEIQGNQSFSVTFICVSSEPVTNLNLF